MQFMMVGIIIFYATNLKLNKVSLNEVYNRTNYSQKLIQFAKENFCVAVSE